MTMKNIKIIAASLFGLLFISACDDNEVLPGYSTVGTATATIATITASNTKPAAATQFTLTLSFVNPSSDPLKTIILKAKVGGGNYVDVQTFDEQAGEKDKKVTREVIYVAPASGTTVTFDMVLTSQKDFPQIQRTSIVAQ